MINKVLMLEIDDNGYTTLDECIDGEMVRNGGYPYRHRHIMLTDIKIMIEKNLKRSK